MDYDRCHFERVRRQHYRDADEATGREKAVWADSLQEFTRLMNAPNVFKRCADGGQLVGPAQLACGHWKKVDVVMGAEAFFD